MENHIKIQLPVTITYAALEGALIEKMVGEFIPPGSGKSNTESPYAQIRAISIAPSKIQGYDVVLGLSIRVLRTLLKRDSVDLYVPAALGYDNEKQLLFVRKFKVDVRTDSGFYNSALEVLANQVAYDQIIKKTRFDIRAIISREMAKINTMLEQGLAVKGAVANGKIAEVKVQDIDAHSEGVSLILTLQANAEVEIRDLVSLMPPKA